MTQEKPKIIKGNPNTFLKNISRNGFSYFNQLPKPQHYITSRLEEPVGLVLKEKKDSKRSKLLVIAESAIPITIREGRYKSDPDELVFASRNYIDKDSIGLTPHEQLVLKYEGQNNEGNALWQFHYENPCEHLEIITGYEEIKKMLAPINFARIMNKLGFSLKESDKEKAVRSIIRKLGSSGTIYEQDLDKVKEAGLENYKNTLDFKSGISVNWQDFYKSIAHIVKNEEEQQELTRITSEIVHVSYKIY